MSVDLNRYPGAAEASPDATADWQGANQRGLLAALAGWGTAVDSLLVDPSQWVTIT